MILERGTNGFSLTCGFYYVLEILLLVQHLDMLKVMQYHVTYSCPVSHYLTSLLTMAE